MAIGVLSRQNPTEILATTFANEMGARYGLPIVPELGFTALTMIQQGELSWQGLVDFPSAMDAAGLTEVVRPHLTAIEYSKGLLQQQDSVPLIRAAARVAVTSILFTAADFADNLSPEDPVEPLPTPFSEAGRAALSRVEEVLTPDSTELARLIDALGAVSRRFAQDDARRTIREYEYDITDLRGPGPYQASAFSVSVNGVKELAAGDFSSYTGWVLNTPASTLTQNQRFRLPHTLTRWRLDMDWARNVAASPHDVVK